MRFNFLGSIVLVMMSACAPNFNLELNTIININESYYSVWNSPIRDGGSGFSIAIILEDKLDLNKMQIEVQGIYFKDNYCDLKFQKLKLYQGFIKKKDSITNFEMEGSIKNDVDEKRIPKKPPFALKNQEAVVVYKAKNIQKYIKIQLQKKSTSETPI